MPADVSTPSKEPTEAQVRAGAIALWSLEGVDIQDPDAVDGEGVAIWQFRADEARAVLQTVMGQPALRSSKLTAAQMRDVMRVEGVYGEQAERVVAKLAVLCAPTLPAEAEGQSAPGVGALGVAEPLRAYFGALDAWCVRVGADRSVLDGDHWFEDADPDKGIPAITWAQMRAVAALVGPVPPHEAPGPDWAGAGVQEALQLAAEGSATLPIGSDVWTAQVSNLAAAAISALKAEG